MQSTTRAHWLFGLLGLSLAATACGDSSEGGSKATRAASDSNGGQTSSGFGGATQDESDSSGGTTEGRTSRSRGGSGSGDAPSSSHAVGGASSGGGSSSRGSNTFGTSAATGGSSARATDLASTSVASTGGASTTGRESGAGGTSRVGTGTGGTSAATGSAYRGVANSPCGVRTKLNVSWYYNWMQTADEPCASPEQGGQFVPMVWGHTGDEQNAAKIAAAISAMVSRGNRYVLGFNEPDNKGQSNLSVDTAIALWPSFNHPDIAIGSPATQANTSGVAWFKDFNTRLNADSSLRADFIAIHWYGWNSGSCDAKASTFESYIKQIEALPGSRPIWITEWGCLNGSDNGSATVLQAHIAGAVEMFKRHPRIERYAFYPWGDDFHHLANDDGTLTPLGEFYASLPAYR